MEIAPIPGIRALPAVKAPQAGFRPPEVIDLERSSRPGDGEAQHQRRQAAGAEENDQDDLMLDAEPEAVEGAEGSSSRVDYFA